MLSLLALLATVHLRAAAESHVAHHHHARKVSTNLQSAYAHIDGNGCTDACCVFPHAAPPLYDGRVHGPIPPESANHGHVISLYGWKTLADVVVNNLPRPDDYDVRPFKDDYIGCLQNGTVIFVDSTSQDHFFANIHPRITASYILITGDSDDSSPSVAGEAYLDDPKVLHWYGQNCRIGAHPKFTCVPIGISQWQSARPAFSEHWTRMLAAMPRNIDGSLPHTNVSDSIDLLGRDRWHVERLSESSTADDDWINDVQSAVRQVDVDDTHLNATTRHGNASRSHRSVIGALFAVRDNRRSAYEAACGKDAPLRSATACGSINTGNRTQLDVQIALYDAMSTMAFTVSPPGVGLDCYRTTEALLTGSIPIVTASEANAAYSGLPVVVLDDNDVGTWRAALTKSFLAEQYASVQSRRHTWDYRRLFLGYWQQDIDRHKPAHFEGVNFHYTVKVHRR